MQRSVRGVIRIVDIKVPEPETSLQTFRIIWITCRQMDDCPAFAGPRGDICSSVVIQHPYNMSVTLQSSKMDRCSRTVFSFNV